MYPNVYINFRVFENQSGCGISPYKNTRIVGGEKIRINQYPWLCSLKNAFTDSHTCGVTLLGIHPHVKETILVGAAHCYGKGEVLFYVKYHSMLKGF